MSSAHPLLALLGHLGHARSRLVLTVAAGTAARIAELALAGGAAWLVAIAITDGAGSGLGPAFALVAGAALAAVLAGYVEQWAAHDAAFAIIAHLRVGLFDGLQRATPRLLLQRRSGDVAAAAMGDAEGLEWFYAHTVTTYIVAVIVPVSAIAALLAISRPVAAVVAIAGVALAAVPAVLVRRAARQGHAVRAAVARVQADALEGVQALSDIVLLRAEPLLLARLRAGAGDLARAQAAFGVRRGAEVAVADALLGGASLAVLAVAAAQVRAGALTTTQLPVLVLLTGAVLAPIAIATASAANLGQTRASAARVQAVVDAPANVPAATGTARPDPSRVPLLELDHVTFRYPGAATDALHDVSLAVRPGEIVALAGPSGAGKTTCGALLVRLWDPDVGAVRVGGADLRDVSRDALAAVLGWVSQEVGLLRGSVADNLRLAAPEADEDRLLQVVTAVGADDVLDALGGLGGLVGEGGATLSGGQRQKLALARALVPGPVCLLLDEPMAHVDPAATTAALDAARAVAAGGGAVLLIAHRREAIAAADRVVHLRDGRVVDAPAAVGDPGVDNVSPK